MEKLQQLLDKHKDELRMGKEDDLTLVQEYWNYYINLAITWESFSLSDLLFSTPFLSLLERQSKTYRRLLDPYEVEYGIEWEKEYHKINLALLATDQERVEYIEKNAI